MDSQNKEADMNPQEQGVTRTSEQHIPNPGRRRALKLIGGTLAGVAAAIVLPDTLKKLAKADSDSSAPSTFRVFLPNVAKESKEESSLRPLEFGKLETDRVLFINRGEKAWVEMGNPELYQNLLKIRDEYSFHPDLKRRIYFYESLQQLQQTSGVPYDYPNNIQLWQWGAYVRQIPVFDENDQFVGLRDYPPTFKNGEIRWQTAPDGAIEFHISLPEPLPGVLPAPEQITYLNVIGFDQGLPLLKFLFSGPQGPYNGMTDKFMQAANGPLESRPHRKYPLIKMLSPLRDYNFIFPVKLVYKEPPSK